MMLDFYWQKEDSTITKNKTKMLLGRKQMLRRPLNLEVQKGSCSKWIVRKDLFREVAFGLGSE